MKINFENCKIGNLIKNIRLNGKYTQYKLEKIQIIKYANAM